MRRLASLVLGQALLLALAAEASEEATPKPAEVATPPATVPAATPAEPLKEAPTIYMRDENGKPQAMLLNWTLQDFEELRERAEAKRQPDRPPPYILQSLSATGAARGEFADLTIDLTVWAGEKEVRVPLRLDQAIVRPDGVEYRGAGQAVLQFAGSGEGHVAWIRGAPEQEHRLALRVVVPLATFADQTRLRLAVPRANTAELKLTVPLAEAVAEVAGGAKLLPPSPGEDGTTVLNVLGFGAGESGAVDFHDLQLTWRPGKGRPAEMPPLLEATGVLLAKLDRRSVSTEATLTVRGQGRPFDRFRILLPKGAQMISNSGSSGAGYSITTLPQDDAGGQDAGRQAAPGALQGTRQGGGQGDAQANGQRGGRGDADGGSQNGGPKAGRSAGQSGNKDAVAQDSAPGTQHSAVSTQHSAVDTQSSILGTPNSVAGPEHATVASASAPANIYRQTLVEVRRELKSAEPMEVHLTTRQPRETGGLGGWFELGGFEVIDAVRQSGYVAVTSEGDWQVRCVPGWGVRQIDQLPQPLEEGKAIGDFDYLFEYFGQPFSLAVRAVEVKTRLRVEPEYRLFVGADQVQLEAKLKYAIRGAKAFGFELELPGWQLDEVGPDGVVASGDVSERSGVATIPLSQPSMGEVEVSIRAHQAIAPAADAISLALPRPHADSISPAVVAVLAADNVELAPRAQAMVGLVRQEVAPAMELRPGQQEPLFYRVEVAEASFVAGFKVHPRKVTAEVSTEVTLGEDKAEVRQTLAYTIAYEPLEQLVIEVPQELSKADALEILLDGRPFSPGPLADQAEAPQRPGPLRRQLALPAARIGRCELALRYSLALQPVPPNASALWTIPLVMPADAELSGNRLGVTAPPGMAVHPSGEGWRSAHGAAAGSSKPGSLALAADQPAAEVVLGIHHGDLASTIVERAWIQTRLTRGGRHDRLAMCFTSDRRRLELVLPAGYDIRQVQTLLGTENANDRQSVRAETTPQGYLSIPLSGDASQRQWLEIEYGFSQPRSGPGRFSLELPRLAGDAWVQQWYWELVLPRTEHVIAAPEGFTPEYRWGWTGSFWGRQPLLDQAELEAWSGARTRPQASNGTNRYLFSSVEPVERPELWTADRWWIVLGASAVVLAAGLLWIYVPACRHPAVLLAVAVGAAGATLLYPGPALLATQAASLGLALVLLAGLLYRTVGPGGGRAWRREASSSVFERSSTQAQYRPQATGKPPSTTTAPAAASLPTSDRAL